MEKRNRVIVIGAGPTGLMTALGLAKGGAQVTVVEAEGAINDSPRANVYMISTVKALDSYGLLDDVKQVAALGTQYNLRFPLTGNIGRLDFTLLEGDTYPYTLHLGQNMLAEVILKHLLAFPGARMAFNTRVTGLEQGPDAVCVKVEADGVEQSLEADWVVAADGARSGVRKLLGIDFEGFTWPEVFMATNVYCDFDQHGYAASNMVAAGEDWHVVAKIDRSGLWRVAYGEDAGASEEERQGRIAQRYKAFLPPGAPFEIERASTYRVHQRSATTYRTGRVLLAGDAAHATNPIGGMGFTCGVQDALCLADALGKVMRNEASDDALDYYAAERRRVFLQIANPSAIEQKNRLQETDRAQRLQDEKNFFAMTADPAMCKAAMLSVFALEGRPYRPDWRHAVDAA